MVLTSILLPSETKVEMPTPLRSAESENRHPYGSGLGGDCQVTRERGVRCEGRVEADEWVSVSQPNAVRAHKPDVVPACRGQNLQIVSPHRMARSRRTRS